jgi:hypothetical protein
LAHYLVVHTPSEREVEPVRPPTRLRELAEASTTTGRSPRWLRAWSPDLHDDRIFSLWDAENADEVLSALAEFGFLDDMDAIPLRVREWGPEDVLDASEEGRTRRCWRPLRSPVLESARAARGVALLVTSLKRGRSQCLKLVPSASVCDGSTARRN